MSLLEDFAKYQSAAGTGSQPATDAIGRCIAQIEAALAEAMTVWQAGLDQGSLSDDRFSVVLWLGAERSQALHALHLKARGAATELAELTGLAFGDTMGIDPAVDVVMPYETPLEDETLAERASRAIEVMQGRLQALREAAASA